MLIFEIFAKKIIFWYKWNIRGFFIQKIRRKVKILQKDSKFDLHHKWYILRNGEGFIKETGTKNVLDFIGFRKHVINKLK